MGLTGCVYFMEVGVISVTSSSVDIKWQVLPAKTNHSSRDNTISARAPCLWIRRSKNSLFWSYSIQLTYDFGRGGSSSELGKYEVVLRLLLHFILNSLSNFNSRTVSAVHNKFILERLE